MRWTLATAVRLRPSFWRWVNLWALVHGGEAARAGSGAQPVLVVVGAPSSMAAEFGICVGIDEGTVDCGGVCGAHSFAEGSVVEQHGQCRRSGAGGDVGGLRRRNSPRAGRRCRSFAGCDVRAPCAPGCLVRDGPAGPCVHWSVMARIAAISGSSSTSTHGACEGTTCGAHRRPGLGFTTVGEPAKQLPTSRVVRVGDQLGFQPGAINPMTSDVSQHPRAQCTVGPPLASHIPVILDREGEPGATLLGHLARANPHWRLLSRRGRCRNRSS
jgi:hypothetical protein